MKKNIILLGAFTFSSLAYSQVGIDTDTPKATLDVMAKATDLTNPDGIIAPRLTGAQLKAKDGLYDTPQTGTIVYVTEALATIDTSTKTVNVTNLGYYYFDGAVWQMLKGTEPWKVSGTTNDATTNIQNIYQTGRVGIGLDPGNNPIGNLQVTEYNTSGEAGFSFSIYKSVVLQQAGRQVRNL